MQGWLTLGHTVNNKARPFHLPVEPVPLLYCGPTIYPPESCLGGLLPGGRVS